MKAALAYSSSKAFGEACHVFVWKRGAFYRQAIGLNLEDALSTMIRGLDALKDEYTPETIADAKRAVLELEV